MGKLRATRSQASTASVFLSTETTTRPCSRRPFEDDRVRRVAQADVLDANEIQGWLAPAQAGDDVAVYVFVSQKSEHGRHSLAS